MSEPSLLQKLLAEQNSDWPARRGRPVEAFLLEHPQLAADHSSLLDLVCNEIHHRRLAKRSSPSELLAEYQYRFPRLEKEILHHFEAADLLAPSTIHSPTHSFRLSSQPTAHTPAVGHTPASPELPLLDPAEPSRFPLVPGYIIEEEIGRGGMGVVFRARQLRPERLVAFKMILAGFLANAGQVQRFIQEAEYAAKLRHENIVTVFHAGEHEGQPYISMELLTGGSLRDRLEEEPLQPVEAAILIATLARAVQHAHERGVIHRDIKPDNVVLTAEGIPKITDFGLARQLGESRGTITGEAVGTPSYMAPEQASGQSRGVGPAADIYALGAILYECLTGRPPFLAATKMDTLAQVVSEEPIRPTKLRSRLSRELETICLKCLDKNPAKRYLSAEELAEDLRRWQAGEPIRARPVGVLTRAGKWISRNRVVAGLSGVVLLALALGAIFTTVFVFTVLHKNRQLALTATEASAAKAQAELARHGSMMTSALHSWQQNDLVSAQATLDDVPLQFQRTWEYRHLLDLCRRKAMPLRGHSSPVLAVAYSPDGLRLATGSDDLAVKVHDARWGNLLFEIQGHTDSVSAVGYSPEGLCIASGSADQTIRISDANSGKHLLTLKGHTDRVTSLAYSPDGSCVITASSDNNVKVWNARSGVEKRTLTGHRGGVNAVAYHPDGVRVASGGNDGLIKVWDTRSGETLQTMRFSSVVHSVAYSPDGSRLVSGHADHSVKISDARTGKQLLDLEGHAGVVLSVRFSPDGTQVVSAGRDRSVRIHDSHTGQGLATLLGHTADVSSAVFSPDGSSLASASHDKTLKIWNLGSDQELVTVKGQADMLEVATLSPDGLQLASGGMGGIVQLREARTGEIRRSLEGHGAGVKTLAYSPDGSRLATGSLDGSVKFWDVASGKELRDIEAHVGEVLSLAFDSDGSRLATAGHDGLVKVWDCTTGRLLFPPLDRHKGSVHAVAFSADGRRLASGSLDNTVLVWDMKTQKVVMTLPGHTRGVSAVVYSPDGNIVTAGQDSMLKVWDADTGRIVHILKGHLDTVDSVACSADGSRIFSGSSDSTVKIWDARTGQNLLTLKGHKGKVASVVAHRNGTILSSGSDHLLKVWNGGAGQDVLTLKGHSGNVLAVAYNGDGTRLVSGGEDGTLRLWDADTGQNLFSVRGDEERISGVAFSPEGDRVFARSLRGNVLAWDVVSGKRLSGAVDELPVGGGSSVTFGRRWAFIDGSLIRLEQIPGPADRPDEETAEARRLAQDRREFHRAQIKTALMRENAFAAVFHIDRLLALTIGDRGGLLQARTATLTTALKREGDNHWAARTLARQAIANPATIPDRKSLLVTVAQEQDAARDHLYGALLLRTGAYRDACVVLRAALRHRLADSPPIEELLLALALAKLNRRAEARQYLLTATTWMDRSNQHFPADSLVGRALQGLIAALGSLQPIDPFTAHELATLRSEVEKAMGNRDSR